jgi:hypothetical protein
VSPETGLVAARLEADFIGTRSDYGPFRDRHVPFLFFSTGQHPDYHRTTDVPERVDFEKLRRISVWIAALVDRLADTDSPPAWSERESAVDMDEIRTMLLLVRRVLAHPETISLTDKKRELVAGVEEKLAKIVASGRVTAEDRTWLLWSARLLLATVF